jgi:hypothetical protein
VFNLGYRRAFEQYFNARTIRDPAKAIAALRDRLMQETSAAPFMKGQHTLVGLEFMEMAVGLFKPVGDGHVFTLAELKARLDAIAALEAYAFAGQIMLQDSMDRALPRLVTAVSLMEAFGYSEMQVTSRQLGTGLIIEAGLHRER